MSCVRLPLVVRVPAAQLYFKGLQLMLADPADPRLGWGFLAALQEGGDVAIVVFTGIDPALATSVGNLTLDNVEVGVRFVSHLSGTTAEYLPSSIATLDFLIGGSWSTVLAAVGSSTALWSVDLEIMVSSASRWQQTPGTYLFDLDNNYSTGGVGGAGARHGTPKRSISKDYICQPDAKKGAVDLSSIFNEEMMITEPERSTPYEMYDEVYPSPAMFSTYATVVWPPYRLTTFSASINVAAPPTVANCDPYQ